MNYVKRKTRFFAAKLWVGLVLGIFAGFLACNNKDNPVEADEKPTPGVYDRTVKVDTMTRWFKLIIPANYDHSESRPLLFAFHGGNLSMGFMYNNRKDIEKRCAEENWILVYPNGANTDGNRGTSSWNAMHCCGLPRNHDVDEISYVRKMVDTLSISLKIDANRIYAMGGSNGGMLTHRLAAEMPDVFAAAAANQSTIGGQIDSLSPVVTVQPSQPIPFMMIHGLNDRTVNFNGGKSKDSPRIDISFRESLLFWATNNQCEVTQPDTTIVNGLNGRVWIINFNGCDANMEVRGIVIENKGHGWPGLEESGFDGTNASIDFLKRFSK